MRMLLIVAAVAALLVLPGCSSQDVTRRAGDLRAASSGFTTAAAWVGAQEPAVASGAVTIDAIVAQVKLWAPELGAQLDGLVSAGASASQVLTFVQNALTAKATDLSVAADQLEARASEDQLTNALWILGAVAAGVFGIALPSPGQRAGAKIAGIAVAAAGNEAMKGMATPNPIPAPPHPGVGAQG
jgi:uncharacterized lipoprotein YmbA